ncbi:MAG: hypothetical protein ACRDV4_09450, partial [Acidimicrobiales bacterium]
MTSRGPKWKVPLVVIALAAMSAFVPGSARAAYASGPRAGAVYVALGDSYSSGEGLGPYQAGTAVSTGPHRDTCHRSRDDAYSDLSPPVVLPSVKVGTRAFWACSGATVKAVETVPGEHGTPADYGQPEQLSAVTAVTKYVTLTVGGDNVGFGEIG